MKYLSLFSGIEAATVAWKPLGWEAVAFSEVAKFPNSVLSHHYPEVPNLGDISLITEEQIKALGNIDVVIGGSPCQDLSTIGGRKGLDGSKSSLFFEQIRVFRLAQKHCGARWMIWENVVGAFSSNKGRDFASVVEQMVGESVCVPDKGWCKEGVAIGRNGLLEWSVLDAQWWGLAQRRKRIFAVLDTGNWHDRPPILLESESSKGDVETLQKEKVQKMPSGDFIIGSSGRTSVGTIPIVSSTLLATGGRQDLATEDFIPIQKAYNYSDTEFKPDSVRVFTTIECERLQGFPDNYTKVKYMNRDVENCPKGSRRKAIGNSMPVNVMRWIGKNIEKACSHEG